VLAAQISLQLASQILAVGAAVPVDAPVGAPVVVEAAAQQVVLPVPAPPITAAILPAPAVDAAGPDVAPPPSETTSPTATTSSAPVKHRFHDPLAPFNRVSYALTQPIDRFVLRPAAIIYKTIIPKFLRDGARNFLNNLHEPMVVFHDTLQLRPKRALRSAARFTLNSTAGLVGVFDLAKNKPFNLPGHANNAGDTLGYYGAGPIAYMYLPVLGPTTLRDFIGEFGDNFAHPRLLHRITHPASHKKILRAKLSFGKYSQIIQIVSGLDQRAEADEDLQRIKADSVDPYANLRANFLQDRAGEIAWLRAKDGEDAKLPGLDDPLDDPAAASAPVAAPAPAPTPPLQKGP
jgi:phospholipid-binding lipoprotein MlaA